MSRKDLSQPRPLNSNDNIDSCELSALPPAPDKIDATRYTIDVENETYIALVEHYGATSNKCGIRRLIYYFIDNEMYEGWPVVNNYVDDKRDYLRRRLKEMRYILTKIENKWDYDTTKIYECKEIINELEEFVNGKPNQ